MIEEKRVKDKPLDFVVILFGDAIRSVQNSLAQPEVMFVPMNPMAANTDAVCFSVKSTVLMDWLVSSVNVVPS